MSVIEDIFDCFRYLIPSYFFILLPLFIIISPIDPIRAAQEFTAYRLQQYDLQGVKIGSRSATFSLEAQTSYSKLLTRKCLLLKLLETSVTSIRIALSQNVGSIIILLPQRHTWDTVTTEFISDLEKEILTEEFQIPIYFSFETEEVSEIYESVRQLTETSKASSASQALINSITSNGYLFYTTANNMFKSGVESQIINIYGKLAGNGIEEQLPTILIVAHYDTMGMAPSLSYGYDSNGSGVVTLLQLIKIFSRLYAQPKSHAKYNIAFLLTGGGKLNYIGTKKWLDDLVEHPDGSVNVDKVTTVVCLERLGLGHEGLFVHVSKPPKEGSSLRLVEVLSSSAKLMNTTVQLVHRKINLNDDELHWEHERFSFKKISALTLSAQQVNKSSGHDKSVLDDRVDMAVLVRNVRLVTESLVRLIYGGLQDTVTDGDGDGDRMMMVTDNHWVNEEAINADLALVTKYPRSQQLLSASTATNRHHPLITVLEHTFRRHLQNTKVHKAKADSRDPDYVLYQDAEAKIVAHKVKPAIFDFMVMCLVVSYLGMVYLLIENFSTVSKVILKVSMVSTASKTSKQHL